MTPVNQLFQVGEPIVIESYTEEDTYTRGYLLCWKLLLAFFKAAPSEVLLLGVPVGGVG